MVPAAAGAGPRQAKPLILHRDDTERPLQPDPHDAAGWGMGAEGPNLALTDGRDGSGPTASFSAENRGDCRQDRGAPA